MASACQLLLPVVTPRTTVALHVETTGLHPDTAAVVEVGAAWWDHGELCQWSSLTNPGTLYLTGPEADRAMALAHLERGTILRAPSSFTVAASLGAQLRRVARGGALELLAGHVAFARGFLARDPWGGPLCLGGLDVVWRGAVSRAVAAHNRTLPPDCTPVRNLSLEAVCEALLVPRTDTHRAAAEAMAVLRCWRALDELEL